MIKANHWCMVSKVDYRIINCIKKKECRVSKPHRYSINWQNARETRKNRVKHFHAQFNTFSTSLSAKLLLPEASEILIKSASASLANWSTKLSCLVARNNRKSSWAGKLRSPILKGLLLSRGSKLEGRSTISSTSKAFPNLTANSTLVKNFGSAGLVISSLDGPMLQRNQVTATPDGSTNRGTRLPRTLRQAPMKLSVSAGRPWARHCSLSRSLMSKSTLCFRFSSSFDEVDWKFKNWEFALRS